MHIPTRWAALTLTVPFVIGLSACEPEDFHATTPTPSPSASAPSPEPAAPPKVTTTPKATTTPRVTTAPSPAPKQAAPKQAATTAKLTTVTGIVDGDTIDTSAGRVRLIGIDTPEMSTACGPPAKAHLDGIVGSTVELRSDAASGDKGRWGRLLRYVVTPDGTDAGYKMIRDGWAIARYDGLDGYGAHRNQGAYRTASKSKVTCGQAAPAPAAEPKPAPAPAPGSVYYKNCTAARAAGAAPVHVGQPGYGTHLDRDKDGIGCE